VRIVELRASNFKRLVAVDISPTGDVVTISGRNGAGKSSLLDAISHTLGGGQASKLTTRPIRDGQKSAEVSLDLGDFVVTRRWKGESTSLTVQSKDGANYPSPQKFLDEKLGALSFDPLAFAMKSDKEQVATLLELVDVGFDPAELERQRVAIFDARTDAGRDLRRAEAQVTDAPRPERTEPREELVIEDLFADRRKAQDAHDVLTSLERQHHAAQMAVADAENALDLARSHAAQVKEALDAHHAEGPLPDLEEIERRMQALVITNREIRDEAQAIEAWHTLEQAKGLVASLTDDLEEIAEFRRAKLSEAKMPVPWLSFDEDGVTYDGVPFRQCSSAERLRVSVAMAMAANPTIRVIRITDGSLLDADNMKVIEDMAGDQDFQVFIERVSDGESVGFVIDEGEVVGWPDEEPETEEAHA
jgi:ABC-type dipeptide/oligopeptide/nickel transport system ATPase component